jgi:hypothetical protein
MAIIIFTSSPDERIKQIWYQNISKLICHRDALTKMNIKDLFGGEIVGTGSDFIVVLKGKNRLLLQFNSHKIIKLKNEATPYGSSV